LARTGDTLILVLVFLDVATAAPVLARFSDVFERVLLGAAMAAEEVTHWPTAAVELAPVAPTPFAESHGVPPLVDAEGDLLTGALELATPLRAESLPAARLSRLIGPSVETPRDPVLLSLEAWTGPGVPPPESVA